ncbi:MAG: hypothetical protein ACK4L4_06565 [Gemmobacter sp.]
MTALTRYQRLEARGLWRDLPEAQRREVVVSLGEASLVLTDPRSDTALTHWSLPALRRINPGVTPARYAPGDETAEELELDDADMIGALETVRSAIRSARPRPGRLRGTIMGGVLALVIGAGVFLLPDALLTHTASVLPPATRADLGRMALADLVRVTGKPCAAPLGQAALNRLSARLFGGQAPVPVVVVREGVATSVHLPGRLVILSEALVAEADGPEMAAGFILAERTAAETRDPALSLLHHAGLLATFRLLTTGALPPASVAGHAETLLRTGHMPPPFDALLARMRLAEVSATPYAQAIDPTGETVLPLIEADPFPDGAPRPLLRDQDWVALQDICTG